MKFRKILVPYGGSEGGKEGFLAAVDLAKKTESEITILSCIEPRSMYVFFETKKDKNEFSRLKKEAEKQCQKLVDFAKEQNIPCNYKILRSKFIPETISNFVKDEHFDVLVLGQTKSRERMNYWYEDIPNYLIKNVKIPILIVKE